MMVRAVTPADARAWLHLRRALLAGAEVWGRSQGCVEFASDAELANDASAAAHRAIGFADLGQVRCFRKDL
jgi:aminoglycoside 6'-N-acetyltransferase I